METKKATYKDVGFIAVPNDNSFSMNLATIQEEYVSGKQVKIISRPFKIPVMTRKYRVMFREFILVSYDDFIIRIINDFREITTDK